MSDYSELNRLAGAATPGTWRTGEWMPKETVGRHQIVVDTDDGPYVIFEGNQNFMDDARANAAFVAEASPVVILGMIAELESTNDRLHEVSVACATAEQGRDAYRAVLEGAGYQNVEAIGKLSPFDSKNIGNLAATMTMGIQQERDQLKVECERTARNRDMWKGQVGRQAEDLATLRAEVAEWKDTLKFNEGCWSEERGTMINKLQAARADIERLEDETATLEFVRHSCKMNEAAIKETGHETIDGLAQERDQLKTEVAGYKTGYEAYEAQNAALRGEVEALRKNSNRYQWLKSNSSVMLKRTVSYTTDLGRINTIYPSASELDVALDAAMGKGEQS